MQQNDYIVSFKSEYMGAGDDDLGAILMQGFINSIKNVKPLPGKMLFYNSAAKLTAEGSAVVDSLKELQQLGVEIMTCGTCADFYDTKDKLGVGSITNMVAIIESQINASKVVTPQCYGIFPGYEYVF